MTEKNKNFWQRLWRLLEPSQRDIKILFFWIVLFTSIKVVSPYILKFIIDSLTDFSSDKIDFIIFLIILMFFVEQFSSFVNYFKDKKTFGIIIDFEYYLPKKAQNKLLNLSLAYHEKEDTGNKITKMERGIWKITELFVNLSWEVAPTLLGLIVVLIVLMFMDWRLAISFAVFAPLFIFVTYRANKKLQPMRKERHKKYEEAGGKITQSIMNINAVKSFTQEEREEFEFGKLKSKIKEKETFEWSRMLRAGLTRNFIIDLGRISVLFLGLYLVLSNEITIGSLVFVITLTEKAYFSLYRLSRFYDRVQEGAEAVNRFEKVLNEEIDIKSPEDGVRPKKIKGDIEFKNVGFAYEDKKALDKISIKINSGSFTALVGPSGGGKTTLARMIYRHYDPDEGQIFLDGVDLREYDLKSFRQNLAIVPQEVEIFNVSVKQNIAYGKPGVGFKEIKKAAEIANAVDFIENLPQKYDTLVGERGIKLSGGQRQRIGIARAILANPQILIFDEATSNLDSQSERLIQDSMDKIRQGRTMIVIAHRLSTIKKADKIVVLENGKIIETGEHSELAKNKGGLYAKLIALQKLGDVD